MYQLVLGLQILPNFGRNLARSRQIWLDLMSLTDIPPNLLRLSQDLVGFFEIWLRSPYISRVRVWAYRSFGRNSRFLTRREPVFGRVRFVGFLDSQTATRTDSIRCWHWRPAAERTTAWIKRL